MPETQSARPLPWARFLTGRAKLAPRMERPIPRWRRVARAIVTWSSWVYFAATLVLWMLLSLEGGWFWPITIFSFGPRWVWALPLAVLIPATALIRPRALWILLNASIVVAGPVIGYCVPWGHFLGGQPTGNSIRILSCNVQGEHMDSAKIDALIAETQPDVVALQEWSMQGKLKVIGQDGWYTQVASGLCLASRYPIRDFQVLDDVDHPGRTIGAHYTLDVPGGSLQFFNLHLMTPREGLQAVLEDGWKEVPTLKANNAARWRESELVDRWASRFPGPSLFAGDFNMPGDSGIFRRFWGQYSDAFESAGRGLGYSKFTRWYGIRIDHVLAGTGWRFQRCWVGPDVGSDHLPIVADVAWAGASG